MRAPEFLRSSALRLALAFAIAMTVASSLVFGLVYLRITAVSESRVRSILEDEAWKGANYSDEEIKNAVTQRLTRDLRHLDYVALFSESGTLLIGNVGKVTIPVDGRSHFVSEAPRTDPGQKSEPAILVARLRPDGSLLMLGRNLDEVFTLRRTVLQALVGAIGPMLLMALAIGAFFARRESRRLIHIHDTIARIMRG